MGAPTAPSPQPARGDRPNDRDIADTPRSCSWRSAFRPVGDRFDLAIRDSFLARLDRAPAGARDRKLGALAAAAHRASRRSGDKVTRGRHHRPSALARRSCLCRALRSAGEFGWRTSQERRVPHFVVQHGLLTPFAPPLPHGATLLAFSDDDAAFWASERSDIEGIAVGAQLLWDTSTTESKTHPSGPPVYLGQLHGSELPRRGKTRSTARFWRQTGAIYRPHPFEADRLSRAQHAIWQARGMRIDRSNLPIRELGGPIVGAFSTGILEAAASGFPAWAYYENPPRWLEEFWDRYRIHRWGADAAPTPAPPRPAIEPAQAIADAVLAATGER